MILFIPETLKVLSVRQLWPGPASAFSPIVGKKKKKKKSLAAKLPRALPIVLTAATRRESRRLKINTFLGQKSF